MKIKGTYRKITAILVIITILSQQLPMQAISKAMDSTMVQAAGTEYSAEQATDNIPQNNIREGSQEDTDTTEDLEEDTTEDIETAEEHLYTAADYINHAYSSKNLNAVEAIEQVEINTDERAASGSILVFGEEGEELASELLRTGTGTIYTGSTKPASITMEYTDDIATVKHPLTAYDLLLFEESAADIGITSQEFLTLSQLNDTPIVYNKTILYQHHTQDGSYHFDNTTGTLLINTDAPFAGTESYRSGGIRHERPLSIKGVTAAMVTEIKYLPTYPTSTIDLGYEEDSLKVNTRAEKIVLPHSITTLKSGFFELATLQDINLGYVTTVAARTFQGCTALEEADLSSARSIGEAAFKDDENLEITAFHPDTQLSENSFENACTGSVKLPENLKSVPALCFQNSQITQIQLPAGLETIKTGAFYKTSTLTQVTIPDSVTHIWYGAFQYSGLKYINIHAGTEEMVLGEQAFGNCKDLIHISFQLKNQESSIQIEGAFSGIAEEADYKVSCQINNSQNQLFNGAYNSPEKDYPVHPGLGGAIRYIGSIILNANGGSVADTAIVYGREYGHLPSPTRQGYRFTGWYDGETRVDNGDEIPHDRGDITLTAQWEEKTGDILSDADEGGTVEIGGDHKGVTSWETLSNQPIYYQNYKLESTFRYGGGGDDIFCSQINSFSRTDKVNAEKLFNLIHSTSLAYERVILNPKGVTLDAKKYKKYKIIDTGLDTDSFISSVTLMNVIYFQNLNYMHKMKNDFMATPDKKVTSYSDLLTGVTPDNARNLWKTKDRKNSYDEYRVSDFEEENINDGYFHYEIKLDTFQDYYNRCQEIDRELDAAAQAIGLNQNTSSITVAEAVTRINAYIYNNFAYDHFYKSWDLYWFFQPYNPQSSDMAQLLRYYHDNEEDNLRNHHGICQSYAFFACALFAKYGYEVPAYIGYENGMQTHMFNQLLINGEPLYIDYCWNADTDEDFDCTKYIFVSEAELQFMSDHENPVIDSWFQTTIDFNEKDSKTTLKKAAIKKVKNKSGNKAVIQYKKVTNAEKYQIQYSQNKNFSKAKSVRVKGNKVTVKNLKKGRTYYFRVRAYQSSAYIKSVKVYGKWSKAKKLKIRK